MIDEKLVEAVARAICTAGGGLPDMTALPIFPEPGEGPEPIWRRYIPEARSAITAYEAAKPASEPVAGPLYDGSIEVRLDDKGGVDEIVGLGVICHVERMSNGTWFMCLTRPDQTQEAFWLAGKGKVEVIHREHRAAPAVGPNVLPWSLSAPASKDGG